ncbi:MAG: hypothetical protein U0556_05045 [Dehalococcoidia bacterium]
MRKFGAAFGLIWALLAAGTASADNCSGPADCLRTAGYTAGIGVVSGLVAVGATIWVVTQTSGPDGTTEERELAYYLELSTRQIGVAPSQPGQFTATAYRALKGGGAVVAGNVAISIVPPTGLKATPATGQGSLSVSIETDGEADGELSITVNGTVEGVTMTDTVQVIATGGDYDLEYF